MRQGLWFLWVLSLAVSLVAWLYLEISRVRNRRFQTRRPVTGCELARQILDRHQFHRTSIKPVPLKQRRKTGFFVDQLVLAESVYYGNRLNDLAEALRETVGHVKVSPSLVPNDLRTAGWRVFGAAILLSWGLILGGVLWSSWGWLISLGQFLFISAFFWALSSLGKEWEIAERAISEMKGMELGTDERIRMKQLLKAMRWTPLAELFSLLFEKWPVKI